MSLNRFNQAICNDMLVAYPSYPGQVFKVIRHNYIGNGFHSVDIVGVKGGEYNGCVFRDIVDTALVFRSHSVIEIGSDEYHSQYQLFKEISGGK